MPYELETQAIGPPRPAKAMRWESEACEELALDLALAGDVFSSVPIQLVGRNEKEETKNAKTADEGVLERSKMLSLATEALSLGRADSPPVQFGYFRPIMKDRRGFDGHSENDQETIL